MELDMEFGIRWSEFDRAGRLVIKQRIFKTEKALEKFLEKLQKKNNFNQFLAYL